MIHAHNVLANKVSLNKKNPSKSEGFFLALKHIKKPPASDGFFLRLVTDALIIKT